MLRFITNAPLFVLLFGAGAGAMFLPAILALSEADYSSAVVFLTYAATGITLAFLLTLATQRDDEGHGARSVITSMAAFFVFAPAFYALPLRELGGVGFLDAWFEMLSCLTTSGGMVIEQPEALPMAVNLWRGLCGWIGGASMLLYGAIMLTQLTQRRTRKDLGPRGMSEAQRTRNIIVIAGARLAPLYIALTAAVMIGLILVGEEPFVAVMHAMGTVSTSGISPLSGFYLAEAGIAGEMVVAIGLLAALSGALYYRREAFSWRALRQDRELSLGLTLVLAVTVMLSIGAFVALWTSDDPWRLAYFAQGVWAASFTALSFLSTTGFEASGWMGVSHASGITSPGIALMGLAAIGGGLATTAGGIKLMRLRALLDDTRAEVRRLVSPNVVEGRKGVAQLQVDVLAVWVTVVLFVVFFAALMLFLTLFGLPLDVAMALSASALSNTSQVAVMASDLPVTLSALPAACKLGVMIGMVLGRLEIIALFAAFVPRLRRL